MGKGWGYGAGSGKERLQLQIKRQAGAITAEEEQQRLGELRQEYNEAIAAGKTAGMGNKTSSLVDDLSGVADVVKSILPDSVVSDLEKKSVEWATEDPKKAAKAAAKPIDVTVEQLYKVESGKANLSPILDDSTVDVLLPDVGVTPVIPTGDVGPIVKEEAADWVQEGGETIVKIVEDAGDNIKKYLPVALIGGAALLLITALK